MTTPSEIIGKLINSSTLPKEKIEALQAQTNSNIERVKKVHATGAITQQTYKTIIRLHESNLIMELWQYSNDKELQQEYNNILDRMDIYKNSILALADKMQIELNSNPILAGGKAKEKLFNPTQIIKNACSKIKFHTESLKSKLRKLPHKGA